MRTMIITLDLCLKIYQKSIIQKGQSKSHPTWTEPHDWREEAARWSWKKKQPKNKVIFADQSCHSNWLRVHTASVTSLVNQRGLFTQSTVWSGLPLDSATRFFFRLSWGSNSPRTAKRCQALLTLLQTHFSKRTPGPAKIYFLSFFFFSGFKFTAASIKVFSK